MMKRTCGGRGCAGEEKRLKLTASTGSMRHSYRGVVGVRVRVGRACRLHKATTSKQPGFLHPHSSRRRRRPLPCLLTAPLPHTPHTPHTLAHTGYLTSQPHAWALHLSWPWGCFWLPFSSRQRLADTCLFSVVIFPPRRPPPISLHTTNEAPQSTSGTRRRA